jgi:predicted nucleic acid-binding protein
VPEYVLADTSVISRLTKRSPDADAYAAWRGNRLLAVNFQILAELLGANYAGARKQRLDDLVSACVRLGLNESTHVWYSRVAATRSERRKGRREGADAGDADMWVLASALEYSIPLFSHDRGQVQLGRAVGLEIMTNIQDLRSANPQHWR